VAQSVVLDHPRAPEFLVRDIRNVIRYLTRLGADVDLDPEEHARALLARSRKRPGDALAGRNGPDAAGPGPDGDGEGEDGAPSRHTN